jgi:hypothetical protein
MSMDNANMVFQDPPAGKPVARYRSSAAPAGAEPRPILALEHAVRISLVESEAFGGEEGPASCEASFYLAGKVVEVAGNVFTGNGVRQNTSAFGNRREKKGGADCRDLKRYSLKFGPEHSWLMLTIILPFPSAVPKPICTRLRRLVDGMILNALNQRHVTYLPGISVIATLRCPFTYVRSAVFICLVRPGRGESHKRDLLQVHLDVAHHVSAPLGHGLGAEGAAFIVPLWMELVLGSEVREPFFSVYEGLVVAWACYLAAYPGAQVGEKVLPRES